jgi:TolB-like protein
MPFKNLSSEPDSDYFVDGLTSEVIRNLAVIDGLQVRSQTSSFSFKNKPRDVVFVGELERTSTGKARRPRQQTAQSGRA